MTNKFYSSSINSALLAIVVLFVFTVGTNAQDSKSDIHFEINQRYAPLSISKETLLTANTLKDLNSFYEDDWVQEYKSVSVSTIHAGKSMTSLGKDDMLSGEQKKLLHHSDPGTEITIDVRYLPKNDLSSNEIKTNSFSFIVNPDKAASFEGGVEKLNAHFYEKAISKIDPDIFVDYTLAAVIFTVDENGEIVNPRMFEPFKDGEVETLLLNSVKSMPCWIPAEYDNGLKVEQEFVLLVGNMANCNVHSLHIRKEKS